MPKAVYTKPGSRHVNTTTTGSQQSNLLCNGIFEISLRSPVYSSVVNPRVRRLIYIREHTASNSKYRSLRSYLLLSIMRNSKCLISLLQNALMRDPIRLEQLLVFPSQFCKPHLWCLCLTKYRHLWCLDGSTERESQFQLSEMQHR